MKRILLDTSVYGELVIEPLLVEKLTKLHESKDFVYYGNKIIRNELRKTPTGMKLGDRKLRIMLLNLYDTFIAKENHILAITELVELIAKKYFNEYQRKGGGYGRDIGKNQLQKNCLKKWGLEKLRKNNSIFTGKFIKTKILLN